MPIVYLIANGTVAEFFDYCLFGMFDFANDNSTGVDVLAIIELLIDKGYSYIDDTNNWVVERQLSDFINEELLLERLTIINKDVKNKILE